MDRRICRTLGGDVSARGAGKMRFIGGFRGEGLHGSEGNNGFAPGSQD